MTHHRVDYKGAAQSCDIEVPDRRDDGQIVPDDFRLPDSLACIPPGAGPFMHIVPYYGYKSEPQMACHRCLPRGMLLQEYGDKLNVSVNENNSHITITIYHSGTILLQGDGLQTWEQEV